MSTEPLSLERVRELHVFAQHRSLWPSDYGDFWKDASPALLQLALIMEDLAAGRLVRVPEWQPIETAPRDGKRIHLGFARMADWDVIGHWQNGDWAHGTGLTDRFYGRSAPTHWKPLPPAPTPAQHQPGESAPSSNGRTPDFDSGNSGSSPEGAAMQPPPQQGIARYRANVRCQTSIDPRIMPRFFMDLEEHKREIAELEAAQAAAVAAMTIIS